MDRKFRAREHYILEVVWTRLVALLDEECVARCHPFEHDLTNARLSAPVTAAQSVSGTIVAYRVADVTPETGAWTHDLGPMSKTLGFLRPASPPCAESSTSWVPTSRLDGCPFPVLNGEFGADGEGGTLMRAVP